MWLNPDALWLFALVVVRELELARRREKSRRHRHGGRGRGRNQADRECGWWAETKRQIDAGYDAFCARRGLDPHPATWVERQKAWFAHLPPVDLAETLREGRNP
jgi:hypothetical protein